MSKELKIEITEIQLKNMLAARLKGSPYSKEVAESIIETLMATDKGIHNLYLAFNGTKTELEDLGYKVGDVITVHKRGLSSWSWDEDLMEKNQILLNDTVECLIISYDRTSTRNIEVSYNYISSSGNLAKDNYFIEQRHIVEPKNEYESINL